MNVSMQFFYGLLIGILVALLSFYSLSAYSQIGVFQSQVGNFENQLSQLKSENAQLTAELQAINQTVNSSILLNPWLIANPNATTSPGDEELLFTGTSVIKTAQGAYTINFRLMNNGTVPLTLDAAKVIVNGRLAAISSTGATVTWGNSPKNSTETLSPGQSDNSTIIKLASGTGPLAITYRSGTSVEIVLGTESRNQFSKDIVLP